MDVMDEFRMHDFRRDVVVKKRQKEYWGNWDNWNILYRTLAYELSSSGDVENYKYVQQQVLDCFPDYSKYTKGTGTLDIMNGWWFCFKTLFDITTSRTSEETREKLEQLRDQVGEFSEKKENDLAEYVAEKNNIKIDYVKTFLEYLRVVYTIGNITPVSNNRHADQFDSWESKLHAEWMEYKKETKYIDYFVFKDYENIGQTKWSDELKKEGNDQKEVVSEYMKSRIELIKKRGKEIVGRKISRK